MSVAGAVERCRELGRKRLESVADCRTPEDWQRAWVAPPPTVFTWGTCWKHTVEYKVHDVAAEIGFFLDVMGFDANVMTPDYVMIMGREGEFYLSFRPAEEGESTTPPDAFSLEYMVADMGAAAAELRARGAEFVQEPLPYGQPGGGMFTCILRTPHGMPVKLWSFEPDQAGSDAAAE